MEEEMRRVFAGVAIAALGLLIACGGGGSSNPEAAVKGMFDALKAGDIDAMMEYMPEADRSEITDEEREMFQGMAGMFESFEYEIVGSEVSEDGETATVTVKTTFMGETSEEDIELMMENGKWVVPGGGMGF